jgi:hypothetical protein
MLSSFKKTPSALLIGMMLIFSSCVAMDRMQDAIPTPLPTLTPTSTFTPTATIAWFPPTRTATTFPTVERTPTPDLRAGIGEPMFSDDFSSGAAWALAASNSGSATVANGHLTLAVTDPGVYLFTTRQQPVLSDFYAETTANAALCSGADEYGMLVRVASAADFYRFTLTCDGRAKVDRIFRGQPSTMADYVRSGLIPATVPGTVKLGVWAGGDELRFFVDDYYLFSVRDTVLYSGTVGFFVRSQGQTAVTVRFSDMQVYEVEE